MSKIAAVIFCSILSVALLGVWVFQSGTCQQLWDTRELHLVSLDYTIVLGGRVVTMQMTT